VCSALSPRRLGFKHVLGALAPVDGKYGEMAGANKDARTSLTDYVVPQRDI